MPDLSLKEWTAAVVTIGTLFVGSAAQANCLNFADRMREIRNVKTTPDTLVLAHRGLWGKTNNTPDMPENSLGAVEAAMDACVDGIELDVKMTSDGVPVLMHDFNLGRTTNVYQITNGPKYDPMRDVGVNPAVSTFPWRVLATMQLLTPGRQRLSGFKIPSIDAVMDLWARKSNPAPLVFDTKTADAVRAVDQAVSRKAAAANLAAAVKVNATLFPTPHDFHAYAHSITAIPVYTTNMLGKISVASSFDAWAREVATIEINVKQPNGLLDFQKRQAGQRGRKVGVFHAIPDSPRPGEFYKATGACCYRLSDLFYHHTVMGQPAGRDTDDRRGDMHFIYDQGFGLITTDDPRGVVQFLARNGRRKFHLQALQ